MPTIASRRSRTPALVHAAAAFGAAALALGIGVAAARSNAAWYAGLARPAFGLQPWAFGPAALVPIALAALAAFRVLRQPDYVPDRAVALRAFATATLLTAGWPAAFFACRSPALGCVEAFALVVAMSAALRRCSAMDGVAAACLIPGLLFAIGLMAFSLSSAILNG